MKIRSQKDFSAGVLYVVIGGAFLWLGRGYRFGTPAQMGPGFFPLVLAAILSLFGLAALARSFALDSEPIGRPAWRKAGLVTLAVVAFALVLPSLGLVIAIPVMTAIAALATPHSTFDGKSAAVLVAAVLFCVVVFVKGLGLPMPILGSLFDGIVPPSWQR